MQINQEQVIAVTNERYRLLYHILPTSGWMNDPNGFVYFKGYYHIFYQYHPYDSSWGPMHWGHYRSKDLINWEKLPAALVPGDKEDEDGCFSGSAIVKDNKLFLIYTGHHYYDKNNLDNFWQNQNLAYSEDGVTFKKYANNPIIANPPEDNTLHFRDPKVWEMNGMYYMVVGSQNQEENGRILLYKSEDLLKWKFQNVITESSGSSEEGFMWECPDLFRLNGKDILLLSPQGIEKRGNDYSNLFQSGYFIGEMDYENNVFLRKKFVELDKGHDFYAPQTMLAPDGRRILFGWMAMWEAEMPEKIDGWAGALTLPRELILHNNRLYMRPVDELKKLRANKILEKDFEFEIEKINLEKQMHLEINFSANISSWKGNKFEFNFQSNDENILSLSFDKAKQELMLYRKGDDPYRYGEIQPNKELKLQVFVDTSSIEIFVNDGEVVFTERIYVENGLDIEIKVDKAVTSKIETYVLKNRGESDGK